MEGERVLKKNLEEERCPFCGSDEIDTHFTSIFCWRCGAEKPNAFNEEEDCGSWNPPIWGPISVEYASLWLRPKCERVACAKRRNENDTH